MNDQHTPFVGPSDDAAGGHQRIKLVVIVAISVIVAYVGGNGMKNAWAMQRKIQCSKQMQTIAAGLATYDYRFDGSQGPPVAFLRKHGYEDRALRCPRHRASESNFVIVGPVKRSGGDAKQVALYEPLSNHDGEGANVLFADGHAEFVKPGRYQELISRISGGH